VILLFWVAFVALPSVRVPPLRGRPSVCSTTFSTTQAQQFSEGLVDAFGALVSPEVVPYLRSGQTVVPRTPQYFKD